MSSGFLEFDNETRLYADKFNFSSKDETIWPLAPKLLEVTLSSGAHFLNLVGHGSPWGCCGINIGADEWKELGNYKRYFICFAQSCSTSKPDEESLGELWTVGPNAGAVAYVGNTSYGYIGWGASYQEKVWAGIASYSHIGLATSFRCTLEGWHLLMQTFTQTLYGDPEMPVWTGMPADYKVTHAASATVGAKTTITVQDKNGKPLKQHLVTVMAGWKNEGAKFLQSKETKADGKVSVTLPQVRHRGQGDGHSVTLAGEAAELQTVCREDCTEEEALNAGWPPAGVAPHLSKV